MENEKEAVLSLEDGEYTVEVELGGGSGRAQVASPGRAVRGRMGRHTPGSSGAVLIMTI